MSTWRRRLCRRFGSWAWSISCPCGWWIPRRCASRPARVRRVAAGESSFHAPLVEDLDAAAHSASAFGAHAGKIEYEAVFGHVRDALVHDFGETDDLVPSGSQGLFRTAYGFHPVDPQFDGFLPILVWLDVLAAFPVRVPVLHGSSFA